MKKYPDDLTGMKFEKLTVLYEQEPVIGRDGRKRRIYLCQCDCENKTILPVKRDHLFSGNTKSCGCKEPKRVIEYNNYDLTGKYGIGWTTNTNEPFYFDFEDYDKIKNHRWYECQGYVLTSFNSEHPRMHRFLLNAKEEERIDHINRNRKDNRKENLRFCTQQENNCNHTLRKNSNSGITGVYWHKNSNRWVIYVGDKYLGYQKDKTEAIKVRLRAEKEMFGDFAPQRHLFDEYGIN